MLEQTLATLNHEHQTGSHSATLHEWYNHPDLGPKYDVGLEPGFDSEGNPVEVERSHVQLAAKDGYFSGYEDKHRWSWFRRNGWKWFTGVSQGERNAYYDCYKTGQEVRKKHVHFLGVAHHIALSDDSCLPDVLQRLVTPVYRE